MLWKTMMQYKNILKYKILYKGYENAEVDSLFSFFLVIDVWEEDLHYEHTWVNQDPTCLYKGKR